MLELRTFPDTGRTNEVGALFHFFFQYRSYQKVQGTHASAGISWDQVEKQADAKAQESKGYQDQDGEQMADQPDWADHQRGDRPYGGDYTKVSFTYAIHERMQYDYGGRLLQAPALIGT